MAFRFKLEHEDGTPADPPTLHRPYRTGFPATRSRWGLPVGLCTSCWFGPLLAPRTRWCQW
jgi:hypothetical protein